MKPSQKQKDLIIAISNEIAGWENTNDIDSPSHWNLIEEFCESLELDIPIESVLKNAIDDIMTIIKTIR